MCQKYQVQKPEICDQRNFSKAWIKGTTNLRTSNVLNHANSSQYKVAMNHYKQYWWFINITLLESEEGITLEAVWEVHYQPKNINLIKQPLLPTTLVKPWKIKTASKHL